MCGPTRHCGCGILRLSTIAALLPATELLVDSFLSELPEAESCSHYWELV